MKKVLLLLMSLFVLVMAGCSAKISVESSELNLVNNDTAIYADGTDYTTIKVYDAAGYPVSMGDSGLDIFCDKSTYYIDSDGRFTATAAGTYKLWVKVDGIESNTVTISVRRGLKIVNAATFSIHLITWEPTANDIYWFTPSTEYSKYYPYDNNLVPTLKSGTSCQQEVIAGTSYLYFVLTGTSDFGYYRTESKISVGTSGAADGRSFEFTNSTTGVETDENQNDIIKRKGVPVLREVVISPKGVRSVAKEIPLIKITKEEMNK